MATQIGLVRRRDTGEVVRIVYPEEHEDDSVLDHPDWLTVGFEHHGCEFEMVKLAKDDPHIALYLRWHAEGSPWRLQ